MLANSSLPSHRPKGRQGKWNGQEESADIGYGLCNLDPEEPQERSADEKGRDEEKPLASRSHDDGRDGLPDILEGHVRHHYHPR